MIVLPDSVTRLEWRAGLLHQTRVIRVLAGADFKLKYADSVLGYFWSLAKPVALFAILYAVFGRALRFGGVIGHYPLFLLIGIVLFTFFSDATGTTMTSIVRQGGLLRKVAFPRLIVPLSVSLAAFLTFAINLVAIVAFIAWNRLVPRLDWLFLLPLIGELYLFAFGVSLILATLYVRFRDIEQIWELVVRMFFYASAVIYPLQLLPSWAQKTALLNPFTQIMQDARAVILNRENIVTIPGVYGSSVMRLVPFAIVVVVVVCGLLVFKHEEARFAERV